jgi:2-polyprenyl-6-hydroxyphenyl methylase/3-demethylubiquinone-9 3-methyltransferase
MNTHSQEVSRGERFGFGKNWKRFLRTLNEERIHEAERSLGEMLQVRTLAGKSFLDVGSGSGLFSLAAMRLGADRVHSFDYDPQSAGCTKELRQRFLPPRETHRWTIEEGNALDADYLSRLGHFDIVYSWGVLHHTGNMWQALENVSNRVQDGGILFVAIYNDQGVASRIWRTVKVLYNRSLAYRILITPLYLACMVANGLALDLIGWNNPFSRYFGYQKRRGMSLWPDVLDWLGGYPFEVARADEITGFYNKRGFTLVNSTLSKGGKGRGNNQYIFVKGIGPEPALRETTRVALESTSQCTVPQVSEA